MPTSLSRWNRAARFLQMARQHSMPRRGHRLPPGTTRHGLLERLADDQLRYTFIGDGPLAPTQQEPATKQSYDGDKNGRNGDIEARMKELQKQRDNEFGSIVRK